MNNKIVASLVGVIALLSVGIAYLGYNLNEQKQVNKDMQELAALDKKEMENEYQQFANQYKDMQTRINNDSIVEQLGREQQRTQELLEELRRTKATDAAEITRLKKELATVRAILRSYVLQIDSLNQVNTELMNENNRVRSELAESNQQNMQLTSSNASLSEKVAIDSQLNAANINVIMLDKKGKEQTKHPHQIDKKGTLKVRFVLSRNATAASGMRTVYCRVISPSGEVINGGGTCQLEGSQVSYTAKQDVDYTGQEKLMEMYVPKTSLIEGKYTIQVIADGHEIGSRSVEMEK